MPAHSRSTRPLALAGSAALLTGAIAVTGPVAPATAASLPFTSCGAKTSATVTGVDVTPHPLRPGRDAKVTLRGTLKKRVTGGSYDLRVTYSGAPLLHRSGNLADLVRLPVPAGDFRFRKTVPVPRQAPSGRYNLQLTAADKDSRRLLCISVPFEVS